MRKCRREDSLNPQEAYHLLATSMVTWQCNVNWLPINYSKNRIHLSRICILTPKLNLNLKSFLKSFSFSMKKKRHTTIPTKHSLTSYFFLKNISYFHFWHPKYYWRAPTTSKFCCFIETLKQEWGKPSHVDVCHVGKRIWLLGFYTSGR